ncbi:MAG: hypothetical protein RQ753_02100 [Desulfurivibrionaceae bacterium]|nr:hypothetical protein [Desulfobulbales bacterium]MDT8334469.1 hypothetical protein [Desulfurivibrionaceae bacterium]
MKKRGEKISLAILTLAYLLAGLRYFPNRPAATLIETATHLLTVAPFLVGAILLYSSFHRRRGGERPPLSIMLRIGLSLGIIIEFFIGLYHYLDINQVG